nr:hypothetical protein CFP56_72206 [Quercus suber]
MKIITLLSKSRGTSANQLKLPRQPALLIYSQSFLAFCCYWCLEEIISLRKKSNLAICLTRGAWEIQEKLIISSKEYWWR